MMPRALVTRGLMQRPAFIAATRIAGAGLGFATQAAMAHLMGARGLGLFYSATSLAIVAGYVTTLGFSQIAPRFAARYRRPSRLPLFSRFVSRAAADSFGAGLVAMVAILLGSLLLPGLETEERLTFAVAGVAVLATTSLTLFTNLAVSIRSFGWCYLPEGLVRPALFLLLILAAALLKMPVTPFAAAAAFCGLTGAIAVVQYVATRRQLPPRRKPLPSEHRLVRLWRREARPLILLSLYTNAFADIGIITATPFLPSSAIAIFGLCLKLSLLVGYVVQVAQQMVVADLADARLADDRAALGQAVRRATILPIAITIAATLFCGLFGARVLSLFGPHFATGESVLVVCLASQVVRAVGGPSSQMLNLAGAQTASASLCIGALLAYLVTILILAPTFGAVGIAWAVLVSYAVWVGGTAYVLARRGEARTDLFGMWRHPAALLSAMPQSR